MISETKLWTFILKRFSDVAQDIDLILKGNILKRASISKIETTLNLRLPTFEEKLFFQKLWNFNRSNSLYEIIISHENLYFKVLKNNNIIFNQQLWWSLHDWEENWDEWCDMAEYDGVSYIDWKESIYSSFIAPFVSKHSDILEIGVGHWRWTSYLLKSYWSYWGLDISKECLDYSWSLYQTYPNCNFLLWDGKSLKWVKSNSIDFIFSFDSFVHIEQQFFLTYLDEFSRVLKAWWSVVIHHSNIIQNNQIQNAWYRASCDLQQINKKVLEKWMIIDFQLSRWWKAREFSVDKFHDIISKFTKKY